MDLHFFNAQGEETSEGAEDSAVQYDEATAKKLGLKFEAAPKDASKPMSIREAAKLAALDGSEPDAPAPEPVSMPPEPIAPPKSKAKSRKR